MVLDFTDKLHVGMTPVANEFIDQFMVAANGEYVKVYLYLIRHENHRIELSAIADALNHTEADVKRALAYWQRMGVLCVGDGKEAQGVSAGSSFASEKTPRQNARMGGQENAQMGAQENARMGSGQNAQMGGQENGRMGYQENAQMGAQENAQMGYQENAQMGYQENAQMGFGQNAQMGSQENGRMGSRQNAQMGSQENTQMGTKENAQMGSGQNNLPRFTYSSEDLLRLRQNDDFAQLLYIAQKYMNKVFTPKDCEVFAYLYEGLKLSVELLEYLVEYCAQNGHTSLRYMEKVALNWHEKGLLTVEAAKGYSESFMKDAYSVMRAFGLSERSPGDSERSMIETWYKTYGFTKEIVVEACNRTLEATHKPSFQYADKILSEWKKHGVTNIKDVKVLDQKRQTTGKPAVKKPPANQFHNFNQRDTDYDALILEGLKE